ncbi:MAG: hypothetical protein K5637_05070 [Lachnospiraceae bacterium]|nr:hypothetical protein [Lachnospiraceae bacterium]
MDHYKSWSGLNKQLNECLCGPLRGRISYFLTRYHKVHDSYGRAAIKLDGKELVVFSWINNYKKERDADERWKETSAYEYEPPDLKEKWEREGVISEVDFLEAATLFLQMPISEALVSDNCLIRIFAVLDKRAGRRTIKQIQDSGIYKNYPEWVQQFYKLRFECLNCTCF